MASPVPVPLATPSPPALVSALDRALAALGDLPPAVRRGEAPSLPAPRLSWNLAALDALTGGGIPRGQVSEIAGPDSAGRTTLGLALLAATTRRGALVTWIDAVDGLDSASAAAAGVDLGRVLWVRAPGVRVALRAAERVLEARGFPLVVLDLPALAPAERPCPVGAHEKLAGARGALASPPFSAAPAVRAPGVAAWTRLARAAAAAGAALLVLAPARHAGVWAGLGLELVPATPRFTGTPRFLEERAVDVQLVRGRGAAVPGRVTTLRLRAADAA